MGRADRAGWGGGSTPLPRPAGQPEDQPDRQALATRLVELIDAAARGHENAFAELYELTCGRIYGLILRVLRSPALAQEVTQEVYVEIWRQSTRYAQNRGSVMAWMTTVAHRRAVDRVRSESTSTRYDLRYAEANVERDVDGAWDGVEQRMDVERVRRGLASLTEIQREALTLAYFGGYTHVEVAKLLKLPLGTAKTRIRDGLIGLRDALGVEA
jgi:RNA polymerase sigma-70 factor, ECF subfamily